MPKKSNSEPRHVVLYGFARGEPDTSVGDEVTSWLHAVSESPHAEGYRLDEVPLGACVYVGVWVGRPGVVDKAWDLSLELDEVQSFWGRLALEASSFGLDLPAGRLFLITTQS